MPDRAVGECADDPADAHRHQHDAEPLRRVLGLEVDGEDHALDRHPRADEHGEEDRQRAQRVVVPHEQQAFEPVVPQGARLLLLRPAPHARKPDEERRDRRHREPDRGRPERRLRADPRDEQSAEGGTDEERDPEHRFVHAVHALAAKAGGSGGLREHRLARRHARRVEDGAEGRQHEEQAEREHVEHRRDRNGGDAQPAEDVRRNRGAPAPEAVDDRPRDERGEHQRQCCDRSDEPDVRRAAGELEHDPRQGDERDAVAGGRHEGRGLERDERAPVARAPGSTRAQRSRRERRRSFSVLPPVWHVGQ